MEGVVDDLPAVALLLRQPPPEPLQRSPLGWRGETTTRSRARTLDVVHGR
jgi:hypothetical protein